MGLRESYAKVAQLVEHNLAKVGVAGSNPVFRSMGCPLCRTPFLFSGYLELSLIGQARVVKW